MTRPGGSLESRETRLHHRGPDGGIEAVGEALRLGDGPLDHGAERRVALLIGAGGGEEHAAGDHAARGDEPSAND
jgi:hypothetical protein